ncbi:hypothetical protein EDB83DRAFT_2363609 [Lactarius deliciosus]|nr:hypothetical protein EDB83DRAFT_2363609 [Lactarius deliciosus]
MCAFKLCPIDSTQASGRGWSDISIWTVFPRGEVSTDLRMSRVEDWPWCVPMFPLLTLSCQYRLATGILQKQNACARIAYRHTTALCVWSQRDRSTPRHGADCLTLLDSVRSRLPTAELAFLSACRTAQMKRRRRGAPPHFCSAVLPIPKHD